jgi:flavin-dependent dehydrogenase
VNQIRKTGSGRRWDAVVVGGRVAGAATALLTARRGLRVLVLERAPAPGTDTLSTHALMRTAVLQLHRWGVLPGIVAAGTPPVRRTTFHYGDQIETVEIEPRPGMPSLFAPRRTLLDALLIEAAGAAGAEVRFGVAAEGLLWEGSRVTGVAARSRKGHREVLHADLVVAADGMSSQVARWLEAPVTWQGTGSGAMVYGYYSGLAAEGYSWRYRTGGSAGTIPTNDGLTCVWAGGPTAGGPAFAGALDDWFERRLRSVAPDLALRLGEARLEGRLRGFPGLPGYLRRAFGPGWALVGDAGAFRDPLSAHGISDALRDAELLTRSIVAAEGSRDPGRALSTYASRRDELALPIARLTDQVASYRWTLAGLRSLLLEQSRAMGREVQAIQAFDTQPVAAA